MKSVMQFRHAKISLNDLASFVILALLMISIADPVFEGLRYAKYGIPFVCIVVFIAKKLRFHIDGASKPFVVLAAVTLLMAPLGNVYGIHDFYFYLTALSPFLVGCAPKVSPRVMFKMLTAFFAVLSVPAVLEDGLVFSVLESTSTLEDHSFAFVFGLFSIFFFMVKDKKYLIVSLILAILVLKRISLLAMVLILTIYYLVPSVFIKRVAVLGLVVNISYLFAAYYITTDSFDHFSQVKFGVSSSFFTMGRTTLYASVFSDSNSLSTLLLGNGPGSSYSIAAASIFVADGKVNLHSDVLKVYYELGGLFFLFFFFMAYKLRDLRIYLFMYINIILFTDNVSTYFIVMYVYFYLAQQLRGKNRSFGSALARDKL